MYESFFNLTGKPFQLNPDPGFYFGSKQHRRASAYLEYGMHQNEGFIVITGEVGAGKTTIVRSLLNKLDPSKVLAAHLVSTHLDAGDILTMVGAAFGIRVREASKADILMNIEAFLVNAASQGKRCLLVVDEAQNLTPRAVEELRMLSNFQFGRQSVLQTFLVGQPEFREILQSPDMLQLRQRVIASCHISPMDREETQAYIEHRLKCVGATDSPSFSKDAFDGIFEITVGVPRRINALCDRLLLSGMLAERRHFTAVEVRQVAKDMEEEFAIAPGQTYRPRPATVAGDGAANPATPGPADDVGSAISALNAEQLGARLIRLERSLLRLEQINSATLALLEKLTRAPQPPVEPPPQ